MLVLFYHLSYHLVATNSGTTRCLYKIKLINISQRRQILCFYSNLNIKYLELSRLARRSAELNMTLEF